MADYLIRLADKAAPRLRRQIALAFSEAEKALRRGQGTPERTILSAWVNEAVPRIEAATRDMAQQVMADAGRATLDQVKQGQAWRYDAVNPRAVEYVRTHTGRLVVAITEQQRDAIRQAIGRVVSAEISSRQAEKHIRQIIGLTPRMESAAWKFRTDALRRGVAPARVDVLSKRYRDRIIRERAETIARTETIDALSAGRQEAWQQAMDSGLLPPTTQKKWIVTPDDRLCPVCAGMAGEVVEMDGVFTGSVEHPPRHPRCRCAITIVRRQATRLRVTRVERVPVLR